MEVSSWDNHLFLWAIYTMAMLYLQKVEAKNLLSINLKPGVEPSESNVVTVKPRPGVGGYKNGCCGGYKRYLPSK